MFVEVASIFILGSGIGRIIVDQTCEFLLSKHVKEYGYLSVRKNNEILKRDIIGKFFTPASNIREIIKEIRATHYVLTRNGKEREKLFDEAISDSHYTTLKQTIDEQDELTSTMIKDAMMLDGTPPEIIDKEYKKALNSNDYKVTEKQRKTLDAMSEADLWLTSIQMDIGLTEKEKKDLFMDYVKDFQNTNENAKPKAIQKTMKIIQSRQD